MRKELKNKIFAYNTAVAANREKAADLIFVVSEMRKLPSGQLRKVLTEEVVSVLQKYGIE